MVYFILAAVLALLGATWSRGASPQAVHHLDRFINTAGLMNRIVNVVDGVRMMALWLSPAYANGDGRGPFAASTVTASTNSSRPSVRPIGSNPAAPRSSGSDMTDLSEFD